MTHPRFLWSTVSAGLSIGLLSILCVVSVPLFSNKRESNNANRSFVILLSIAGSCFLFYETNFIHKIRLCWHRLFLGSKSAGRRDEDLEHVGWTHNYLAYSFFAGHLLSLLWQISNEIYQSHTFHDCFHWSFVFEFLSKLSFSTSLMFAMGLEKITSRNMIGSYFGWSLLAALCFGSAFRSVVEEVIQAYINIVERSIRDEDYGLLIPSNTTHAIDYVPLIFKQRAKCLENALWPWFVEYVLEIMPFSTEYYCLSTFFCFETWKDLESDDHDGHAEKPQLPLHLMTSREDAVEMSVIAHQPEETVPLRTVDDSSQSAANVNGSQECGFQWYSISKKMATFFSLVLILLTGVSCYFFLHEMHRHDKGDGSRGILIFFGQQIFLQSILFISENLYFWGMIKTEGAPSPPLHFRLDILLLIFPLFPLGILNILRIFPGVMQLWDPGAVIFPPGALSPTTTILNCFLAVFNWVQVAFQALFISQVLCRLKDCARIQSSRCFFSLLALVNACIWFTWTFECKLVTLHGKAFQIYGAVEWTILVYSNVPFVLFCFAHTTACFLDIIKHIPHKPRNINFGEMPTAVGVEKSESVLILMPTSQA